MADVMRARIKERLDSLELPVTQVAKQAGLERSYLSDYLVKKKASISAAAIMEIARVLRCDVGYLYGEQEEFKLPKTRTLPLMGRVAAGTFVDPGTAEIPVQQSHLTADPRYPAKRQYVLKVEGDSMDLILPPGSIVHCVDWAYTSQIPVDGMLVVVRQERAQLYETTVKVLRIRDEEVWLVPMSSNKAHAEIYLGSLARARDDSENTISISGIVIGYYLSFPSGLLES